MIEETELGADASPKLLQRACPHCAVISTTDGDYCPNCGKRYVPNRKRSLLNRKRLLWIGPILVVVLVAGGVGVKLHNDAEAEKHSKQVAVRKSEEGERERHQTEANEAADEKSQGEKLVREALVHGLEKAITKDASKEVAAGTLEGPILHSSCTVASGGSPDNLSANTGQYQCIAVNKKEAGGEESGYRYTARIDFSTGAYSWHLGGE